MLEEESVRWEINGKFGGGEGKWEHAKERE